MDIVLIILAAAAALVAGCVFYAKHGAERERQNIERQNTVAENYIAQARTSGLPTVETNVMLKRGEAAFYFAPSALFETRAVRRSTAGHGGFRIARGVWVGGTRGRAESHQEWRRIDDGDLTVTNRRIIFDGRKTNRAVPLDKLLSCDLRAGEVEISTSTRQKSMVFTAGEQAGVLVSVIKFCSSAINDGAPYSPAG